jgi:N-acetylmuramoyl-L-alanine amidase
VFKVQILASSTRLQPSSPRFKGQTDVNYYEEGGLFKYTIGASEDYNEISRLRKSLLENFPEAFIIAFRGGQKTDVRQAIQEFKSKKK